MQEMMTTFQASNSNLLEITGNLKTISRRLTEGQGTLGQLINDPEIADHLRTSIDHLRNATAGSEKMIANLEAFSDHLPATRWFGKPARHGYHRFQPDKRCRDPARQGCRPG